MFAHMIRMHRRMALLVAAGVMIGACAKKAYIDVDYRLPMAAPSLVGRTIFIETRDHRTDKEMFNQRAKDEFPHFAGFLSLRLQSLDDPPTVLGAYEVPELFETAIARRLEKMGVALASERAPDVPVFQVRLDQFTIKLIGRKWMADIRYEASLTRDGRLTAREVVSGSAERMKIMGRGGAEKVISEIFTEMINRLNIERLFQQAQL